MTRHPAPGFVIGRLIHSIRFQLPAALLVLGGAALAATLLVVLERVENTTLLRRVPALRTLVGVAGQTASHLWEREDLVGVRELVAGLPGLSGARAALETPADSTGAPA